MEIHVPHEPILTVKQAIVHLAIVTAGILIALSLEGAREWREHRVLVNEARANLLNEVRDNRKELAGVIGRLDQAKDDLSRASEVARTLAERPGGDTPPLRFNAAIAQLGTASRTTAEVTGAFGYMEYEEAKRFAEVYDLQSVFARTQDKFVDTWLATLAGVQLWDPKKATPRELEDWTRQIRLAYAAVIAEQQIAAALVKSYDAIIQSRP